MRKRSEIFKEKLKQVDWVDVLVRSIKTFLQSTIPVLLTAIQGITVETFDDGFKLFVITTLGSAFAGGICAVWNGVLSPLWDTIHASRIDEHKEIDEVKEEKKEDDKYSWH